MKDDSSNGSDSVLPTQTSRSKPPVDGLQPQHRLPERIGHYTIEAVIGQGGMGTVYKAMQESPRRPVALKVVKRGVSSRSALKRLQYEAQTLGRLRHENIAQIYEAGMHDDGDVSLPYFAMEYIPGAKTITEYAEENELGTRQRLALFAKVCDAVQHGHQKGIIHRDLKPGNILVTGSGVPKVIDFGVARSTDSDMAVTTLRTDLGQLIGTLQYMSPEQCEADPDDIDTRSDIYALGMVLYELLTGSTPYNVRNAAIHEAVRIIREEEPTKLSTVNRRLRGDIETLTLKALEKNRAQRYQSATELGQDIGRYLRDEPISARPPGAIDNLRRFIRRNKAFTLSTAAIMAILLASGLTVLIYANEMADEKERTALEAETKEQILTLAVNLLDQVLPVNTDKAVPRGLMEQMLANTSTWIEDEFETKPVIAAQLFDVLADNYSTLGMYENAMQHYDRALPLMREHLGDTNSGTLITIGDIGTLYYRLGQYEMAEPKFREAVAGLRATLGEEDPMTLIYMNNLALVLRRQEKYDDALSLLEEVLEANRRMNGDEHPDTLLILGNIGNLFQQQEKYEQASAKLTEALEILQRTLGNEHPNTVYALRNMGVLYFIQGRYEETEPYFLDALENAMAVFGQRHPETSYLENGLGVLYNKMKRHAEAEPHVLKAIEMNTLIFGEDHQRTFDSVEQAVILHTNWHEDEPDAGHDVTAAKYQAQLDAITARMEEPAAP